MDDRVFPFASFPPGLGLFSVDDAEDFPRSFLEGFFGRLGVSALGSLADKLSLFLTANIIQM